MDTHATPRWTWHARPHLNSLVKDVPADSSIYRTQWIIQQIDVGPTVHSPGTKDRKSLWSYPTHNIHTQIENTCNLEILLHIHCTCIYIHIMQTHESMCQQHDCKKWIHILNIALCELHCMSLWILHCTCTVQVQCTCINCSVWKINIMHNYNLSIYMYCTICILYMCTSFLTTLSIFYMYLHSPGQLHTIFIYVKAQFATSGYFWNRLASFQAIQLVSKLATRFIWWIYGMKFYVAHSS